MDWVSSQTINREHASLPITQVYCWLITKDKKYISVSKNGQSWQLPGGKPDTNDTSIKATAIREVYEETGLDIKRYRKELTVFGYYVVSEKQTQLRKSIFK